MWATMEIQNQKNNAFQNEIKCFGLLFHPLSSTSTKPYLRAHLTSSVLLPVPVFLNRSLMYLCRGRGRQPERL